MVFGGFHSSTCRFNDIWYFNIVSLEWSRPVPPQSEFTPRGNHIPSKGMLSGVPSPRGGHTASKIDSKIYIFGGYGGLGYSRRDFDDLYVYDVENVSWAKLLPKGKGPEKRSGHQACAVSTDAKRMLYIFGGWNSIEQFNDMYTLDLDTMTWSNIPGPHMLNAEPRWNHAACAVVAIPNYKIFTFGGTTGKLTDTNTQGTFNNDVCVMDTGNEIWLTPPLEGKIPEARADCEMAYDAKGSRLMIFGGWANHWFDQIYTLNVSSVVGPPYAIVHMTPKLGPITGGTDVLIEGIDFVNTPLVVVRFGGKKGTIDVPGEYVSETHLKCKTPDFQRWGAGDVEVRVSLKGDSFTTTHERYSFFAVSDATKCLAFGPGVLVGQAVGDTTMFVIQARDTQNNARVSGGDEFTVKVRMFADEEKHINVDVEDMDNGTYVVTYVAPEAGGYEVAVEFAGTFGGIPGPIRGGPFLVEFADSVGRDNNLITGKLVNDKVRADIKELKRFTKKVNEGLSQPLDGEGWTAERRLNALISIKEDLLEVEMRMDEINYMIDRLNAILGFLKSQGANLSQLHTQLEASVVQWGEVLRKIPIVVAKIAPLVKSQKARTGAAIEAYEAQVDEYEADVLKAAYWDWQTGPTLALKLLEEANEVHVSELKKLEGNNHLARMFDCTDKIVKSQEMMTNTGLRLERIHELWVLAEEMVMYIDMAKGMLWPDVDSEGLEEKSKEMMSHVKHLHKEVKDKDAYSGLSKMVIELVQSCPLISLLRAEDIKKRHWLELMKEMKKTGEEAARLIPMDNEDLLMQDIYNVGLQQYKSIIEDINDKAQKEQKQETVLAALETSWAGFEFLMLPYKDTDLNGPLVPLLRMGEEDFEQLEADQLTVQGMLNSRYNHFKKQLEVWSTALSMVSEVVTLLGDIQRSWSYLEPLFIGSEEVKKELPEDAERFAGLDADVKRILKEMWSTKLVKPACNKRGLLTDLQGIVEKIEICKKALKDFLDGKRKQFPRFYFVSEADLLDILSNGSAPEKIMKHIDKVMISTKTLTLQGDSSGGRRPTAVNFVAGVGVEEVEFEPALSLDGKVESYLAVVLKQMMVALQTNLERSVQRYPTQARSLWIMNKVGDRPTDPAQITLLVAQIMFATDTEEAFSMMLSGNDNAMKDWNGRVIMNLKDLIKITRTQISRAERQRVMVMITLDAHSRDITHNLIDAGCETKEDFMWQAQLKQRYIESDEVNGCICDAQLAYSFEYLGNGPRLVVTPLTDRIYVTATQALHLKMGCAPAGPAGTGKTETTKDLANSVGKVCYVFNCSPEMDYQSLGNIFKGLSSSGAWGCFDEFNRLVPEVLSVCTVQFKAVCEGCKAYGAEGVGDTIVIEGDTVSIDPTCGAFITMNPGYLGRSSLPEGLKALFRPMTVMVPDLVMICENMMMAEGFNEAKTLSSKFFSLYQLLAQLLSKQEHYDWGLRAIKSVLVVAGVLKRQSPDMEEDVVLMRALRDFNIPKIVKQDEVVFSSLLSDLFPGLDPPRQRDAKLEECVHNACEQLFMWRDETFMLKVVQLEELVQVRHCVFLMGPPGAGKTQAYKTLARARGLQYDQNKTKVVPLNPKAITTEELYGCINLATREWKDGLLSKIMRDLGNIEDEKPKWLILDGDLDANWIESMNSVMDDNRMLTLASNERIPLKSYMRMLFEIRDLKHATPATVSRAGILYISADDGSQWRSLMCSWVMMRPESWEETQKETFSEMFLHYLPHTLDWIKRSIKQVVPLEEITLVQTMLYMLEGVLDKCKPDLNDKQLLETYFCFCLVWGFGSALGVGDDGTNYRTLFSDWWRKEWKQGKHGPAVKFGTRQGTTIFDYWFDVNTGNFQEWKNSPFFKAVTYDGYVPMEQITVPTPETTSTQYWLQMLVEAGRPIMLCGPAGTGKTQAVQGLFKALAEPKPPGPPGDAADELEIKCATVNFNFYTNAALLQLILESKLQKRSGTTFGPPGKTQLVYFVDDLNLPEVDKYNTQSAIALMRQHMDYQMWFDLTKLQGKHIHNTQWVACMNPSAGCFFVNPRLQRHFCTFAVSMPSPTSLLTIYETFLEGHLKAGGFEAPVAALSGNIIKAALALHTTISNTFRKTAANFHYEFNIRHLANVFQGLLMSQGDVFAGEDGPPKFVRLWLHESQRVYGDRLVNAEDLANYQKIAQAQTKKLFPTINVAKYFSETGHAESLCFCHFAYGTDEQRYNQVISMEKLREILEVTLAEHNEICPVMDLVLFNDAMEHVCRIVRIMKNPAGHGMLVGVGGSGKQSLARLSAFICGYGVSQIVIHSAYGIVDLKADLQVMYNKAGVKGEGVMFLLTDSQISNERFLVYINDLLASGNIPDLYSIDEQDQLIAAVTTKAKSLGYPLERDNLWDFFLGQVRSNLHCVCCFSPVGDPFRVRARRFPALVNCTVIDWFQPWPQDALHSVGKKFLASVTVTYDVEVIDEETGEVRIEKAEALGSSRDAVEDFMPFSFLSVNDAAKKYLHSEHRNVHCTPKSYLELLKLYSSLLAKKVNDVNTDIERLSGGLKKMDETEAQLTTLEDDIRIKLALAEEKKAEATEMATKVEKERAIVEEETRKADAEHAKCDAIAAEVMIKQADAEADLAKAEPAVIAAMAALDTLNKKDLGNCKTMSKPPAGVDDVFAACMVLMAGINPNIPVQKNGKVKDKDLEWDSCKKYLMGNINAFLEDLKNYKAAVDDSLVPVTNWREIRPFLAMEHFNVETIEKKNSAAAGLCSWAVNIVMYYDIVVEVEPKRVALREANAILDEANEKLAKVQEKVDYLKETFDKLNEAFETAKRTVREAEESSTKAKGKLELARRLTVALGSENERWNASVAAFKVARGLLVGDVLLASAFISYIGPFTKAFREDLLLKKWVPYLRTANYGKSVPMSDEVNPSKVVTTDSELAKWHTQGLPSDSVSNENGAIVSGSARWPLLIDPQLQAIKWVRNKENAEKGRKLYVMRLPLTNETSRVLERALEDGKSVLIENMGESIEAQLWPMVCRATFKKGTKSYVKMGEKEMEWNDNFRLFMHTKLANPHYPPEIQAECTLVNFTVTPVGLEEQLLSLVVKKERPDLASQKTALVQQQNNFKIKIQQMEDDILRRLAEAEGDVTDDVDLIEGLEKTKKIADDIKAKVVIAIKTELDINLVSEKYREVAARGSVLFFLMNDLHKIHSFYMYSLNAFVVIFQRGIDVISAGAAAGAGAPGGKAKGFLLNKLKAAAKKVISTQRFGWNDDLLYNSRMPDEAAAPAAIKGKDAKPEMSEAEVHERCLKLQDSITSVLFNYLRRGLFEADKLIVAAQLTFLVLRKEARVSKDGLNQLILNKPADECPGMGVLSQWMPESAWPRVKALEALGDPLTKIGDDILADHEEWKEWFNNETPEMTPLPGNYKDECGKFERLLLLRCLRPDRLTVALQMFVAESMGKQFTPAGEPNFNMAATYAETTASTPILFVLFPGVDPTPWVETLGHKFDVSLERGNFVNISMGQGQEKPAEELLHSFSQKGSWIMLQNVHLMQSWLPRLERTLETCSEKADPAFRCFISAEPPPMSHVQIIPQSLLQSCIKVANQAPADLKSNLRRAWANFDAQTISDCTRPKDFKVCLFGLCFFHSVVLGRRRFGQQGWSVAYSFNTGDLTICANVLRNYIEANQGSGTGAIPWNDLRYIFGEIMYGGHVTDAWDRRTAITYLQVLFTPGLFDGMALAPGFTAPRADEGAGLSFDEYTAYVEEQLPAENPTLFGLHPNAEIGYLTLSAQTLFEQVIVLSGGIDEGDDDDEGGGGAGGGVGVVVEEMTGRLPKPFDLLTLDDRARPLLDGSKPPANEGQSGPYVVVILQECERMNKLLHEQARSMEELVKGLNGQLNMSQKMEDLAAALSINQVPGRNPFSTSSWEVLAWPSQKSLMSWFNECLQRQHLLSFWSSELSLPLSLWLPGLFNPQAFLTAVKQVTARREEMALDKMTVATYVTTMMSPDAVLKPDPDQPAPGYPDDGAYIHGLFIEGARWAGLADLKEDDDKEPFVMGVTPTQGYLTDCRLKELLPAMPVMYLKAVEVMPEWDPQSVGYLRRDPEVYDCPVYSTSYRGPTYVFLATLKTKDENSKWILSGTALIMQERD
jgi:dynein heavy chain